MTDYSFTRTLFKNTEIEISLEICLQMKFRWVTWLFLCPDCCRLDVLTCVSLSLCSLGYKICALTQTLALLSAAARVFSAGENVFRRMW